MLYLTFHSKPFLAWHDVTCAAPMMNVVAVTRYLRSNITVWMGKVSLEYGRDDWRDATMLRALRVAAGYIV
jgi:hypothetical protein